MDDDIKIKLVSQQSNTQLNMRKKLTASGAALHHQHISNEERNSILNTAIAFDYFVFSFPNTFSQPLPKAVI